MLWLTGLSIATGSNYTIFNTDSIYATGAVGVHHYSGSSVLDNASLTTGTITASTITGSFTITRWYHFLGDIAAVILLNPHFSTFRRQILLIYIKCYR